MLIDSSLFYSQPSKPSNLISSTMLNYNRPKDPVQMIVCNPILSKEQKIEKIDLLLVNRYGIIEGKFSRILAIMALGDKIDIQNAKKAIKRDLKKLQKKKSSRKSSKKK